MRNMIQKMRPIKRSIREAAIKSTWLMSGMEKTLNSIDEEQSSKGGLPKGEKPKVVILLPEPMSFWSTVEGKGKLDKRHVCDTKEVIGLRLKPKTTDAKRLARNKRARERRAERKAAA